MVVVIVVERGSIVGVVIVIIGRETVLFLDGLGGGGGGICVFECSWGVWVHHVWQWAWRCDDGDEFSGT